MSTVRKRCLDFIKAVRKSGYAKEIPLESAKIIFSKVSGLYDRATIKAYFGSQPGTSIRKIQRFARYQSGTASFKTIELAQDIPHKKGYLELLELATIEKKGSVWFLKLNEISIIAEMNSHNYEGSEKSITNISLSSSSLISQGEGSEGNRFEKVPLEVDSKNIKNNNNLQGEREKSENKHIEAYRDEQLDPHLLALARAKRIDEPDKARVEWVET